MSGSGTAMRQIALPLLLALGLAAPLRAQDDPADAARSAAASLAAAIDSLDTATGAQDRVAALTLTIRAYEDGLAAAREALRRVTYRDAEIRADLNGKRERVSRLVGVMTGMSRDPAPVRVLHPAGPLGAAQAAMILGDIAPALEAETHTLRQELAELGELRALQQQVTEMLEKGLGAAQTARTDLAQAISDRRDLPQRFTEDPAVLRALIESHDTLDSFAEAVAGGEKVTPGEGPFGSVKGDLMLPVAGELLRGYREPDAAGVSRPGMIVAAPPRALVVTPASATIRYIGPLDGYGNVVILEPAAGYLMVLAGLGEAYGRIGQVVPAGSPVGLMGGEDTRTAELSADIAGRARNVAGAQNVVNDAPPDAQAAGATAPETLYIEVRQGGSPVDPAEWFAETRMFP